MRKLRYSAVMAILFTFLLVAMAQATNWQLMATDGQGVRWYVDSDTVKTNGTNMVGAMMKIVPGNGTTVVCGFAANYRTRTFVLANAVTFDASGQPIGRDQRCSPENVIQPNSPADRTLNYIMGLKALY